MSDPIIYGDGGPGTVVNLDPPADPAEAEARAAAVDEAPHEEQDEEPARKPAAKKRGGRRITEPAPDAPLSEAPED